MTWLRGLGSIDANELVTKWNTAVNACDRQAVGEHKTRAHADDQPYRWTVTVARRKRPAVRSPAT